MGFASARKYPSDFIAYQRIFRKGLSFSSEYGGYRSALKPRNQRIERRMSRRFSFANATFDIEAALAIAVNYAGQESDLPGVVAMWAFHNYLIGFPESFVNHV